MKLNKLFAGVSAAAVAVSAMAVSAFAADPITVKLNSQNTESWTMYSSEEYVIDGDGDYTFTLDAGGENNYITLYIKDVTEKKPTSDGYENAVMTINSITVNGKKLGLTQTEFPLLNESTGVFDVCPINGWATTYVIPGECAFEDADGGSFSYGEPVNTFEVNCTISGIDGGAAEAAPAETEAAPDETEAAPVETTAPATGNTTVATIAAVMAVAGAAAVISKKRG